MEVTVDKVKLRELVGINEEAWDEEDGISRRSKLLLESSPTICEASLTERTLLTGKRADERLLSTNEAVFELVGVVGECRDEVSQICGMSGRGTWKRAMNQSDQFFHYSMCASGLTSCPS